MPSGEPEEGRAVPGPTDALPGWRVIRAPGRLRIERRTAVERAELSRRAVTGFGSLFTAVALFFAADQFTGARLVLWPLSAATFAVTVLSVFATRRAWRRLREGVFLEAAVAARTVTGFPLAGGGLADYRSRLVTVPFEQVDAVELVSFPGGSSSASLRVVLHDGRRLEGPSLEAPTADLPAAAARLQSVAAELAQRCGRPLRSR